MRHRALLRPAPISSGLWAQYNKGVDPMKFRAQCKQKVHFFQSWEFSEWKFLELHVSRCNFLPPRRLGGGKKASVKGTFVSKPPFYISLQTDNIFCKTDGWHWEKKNHYFLFESFPLLLLPSLTDRIPLALKRCSVATSPLGLQAGCRTQRRCCCSPPLHHLP